MQNWIDHFFDVYLEAFPPRKLYTNEISEGMMASAVDSDGRFEWRLTKGSLSKEDYQRLEKQFGVQFPESFIEWHKSYFFLDGDCSLLRLPYSIPGKPLEEIKNILDWFIPQQIIPQQLYPFATEGNDAGILVFDGRESLRNNDFPIRIYDHDYGGDIEGLSEVIFSSFHKLMECLTYYCRELKHREILRSFLIF